jgi:hypothetical protein
VGIFISNASLPIDWCVYWSVHIWICTRIPKDIPFDTNASAMGNIVSGLIYIGMPITDAMNTDITPSPLAYFVINVSGTNPYMNAPIRFSIFKNEFS